ncbi:MAG: hypothetical protein AAFP19_04445 [Bacteroidota bacterium]
MPARLYLLLFCIFSMLFFTQCFNNPAPAEKVVEPAEETAPPRMPDEQPKSTGPNVEANKPKTQNQMPAFPWPPPKASAQDVLPASFFESADNLKDVDKTLRKALEQSGYYEHSYFRAPKGFALVTRIERINDDASPKANPDRWQLANSSPKKFSLSDYFKALFSAPKGLYRVIVFIVSDQAFAQSEESVSQEEASQWLSSGANRLDKALGQLPFTEDYACTALIYEFAAQGNAEPIFADPSTHLGRTHLEKSDLLEYLKGLGR